MIKKLKFRFITVAMAAVVVVLGGIMTAVNLASFSEVARSADELTATIAAGGGTFDFRQPEISDGGNGEQRPSENGEQRPSENGQSDFRPERPADDFKRPDAPYETRYFTVFYDGENYTCDLSRIAAIDENEAVAMAKSVLSGGSDRGYKGEVYRYLKTEIEGKQAVVFVDCFRQMQTARQFLLYSVVISLVGIAGVFALIFFLSGKALKPVIESYEKQKRFITDAGHELKTPLTVISANNEIIEIEHGEDECTRAISAQVNKMNALVKNLTALARMEEGGGIKGEEFSLSDALNEAAENFRSVFDRSDKKFTVETEENLYKGDESLIRRLFYLILDNCAKYSVTFANVKEVKEGGKIKIYFKNDAENLTGGDMPEVFERFYRSAESRATKEGSGIGLSVAKEIVLMHGGKISARAEGGIFCIEVIL